MTHAINDYSLLINYVIFLYTLVGMILLSKVARNCINNKKILTIVRGVPGIGKDTFVSYIEHTKNDMEIFSICNDDMFFSDNKKKFSIKDVDQSKKYTLQLFLEYIRQGVNRIYITNTNQSIIDYEHYISIARTYNYTINIVQIDCCDEEHLKFFHDRSKHSFSDKHLANVYNTWEEDSREHHMFPFIRLSQGDPLPKRKSIKIYANEYSDDAVLSDESSSPPSESGDSSYSPSESEEHSESESESESAEHSESESAEHSESESESESESAEHSELESKEHIGLISKKTNLYSFKKTAVFTKCPECNINLKLRKYPYDHLINCNICKISFDTDEKLWHCLFCEEYNICQACYDNKCLSNNDLVPYNKLKYISKLNNECPDLLYQQTKQIEYINPIVKFITHRRILTIKIKNEEKVCILGNNYIYSIQH